MHLLQIKARCDRPLLAARQMALLGSAPSEQLVHVDTYFGVPTGRLMLREFRESLDSPADTPPPGSPSPPAPPMDRPRRPLLIATIAETPEGPSDDDAPLAQSAASAARVFNVSILPAKDPARVRDLYARMFGIVAVLKKSRTSFPFHDLAVHLDEVVGLGSFVEIHAPLDSDLDATARARDQADALLTSLGLPAAACTADGYLDLLRAGR
jgi:hypothetical protein